MEKLESLEQRLASWSCLHDGARQEAKLATLGIRLVCLGDDCMGF